MAFEDEMKAPGEQYSAPMPSGEMGPFDALYRDSHVILMVAFGVCCSVVALWISLFALVTAKDKAAKKNAIIVSVISAVMVLLNIVLYAAGVMAGLFDR